MMSIIGGTIEGAPEIEASEEGTSETAEREPGRMIDVALSPVAMELPDWQFAGLDNSAVTIEVNGERQIGMIESVSEIEAPSATERKLHVTVKDAPDGYAVVGLPADFVILRDPKSGETRQVRIMKE